MSEFQIVLSVLATVVLFLYGLQSFSYEVQNQGREHLQHALTRLTSNRFSGFLLGAVFTALVQSSSAVSSLVVSLVNAGALSFSGSLAVLLGANVGTTATAWLVSFKLTGIGPLFIVLGALLSVLPGPLRVAGKSIFYFGLIFFALDLISLALTPVKNDPRLLQLLAAVDTPLLAVVAGLLITALVQSSSVVTGLVVLLVAQGSMDVHTAIAIIVGANAGSTATALLASLPLSSTAKHTALANLLFNLGGVLLYLPLLPQFSTALLQLALSPAITVALAHLIFNCSIALLFLPLLGPIARLPARLAGR